MRLKGNHLSKISGLLFIVMFIILSAVLAVSAVQAYFDARVFAAPAQNLSCFTYEISGRESGEAAFPYKLNNIPPRTAVTILTDIEPGHSDSLLVKTVYTSLRLYADNELIYECGKAESYPPWLMDPPTLLEIIPLPRGASQLRFEYTSPSQRSVMSLPAPRVGNDGALLAAVFSENGGLLAMSIFFLFFGLAVSVISVLFWQKGKMFLYLGLFSISTGCWSFGECNATAFLVPYPVLLYLMAFGGLFTLSIPFLHYGRLILDPRNRLPIKITKVVMKTAVIAAFILQISGIAAFSKTMYLFHVLIPLSFIVFAATAVWEYAHYRNKAAKRFVLPALILALSSVMEVVNYRLHFTSANSLFFILGACLFTLVLGIVGIQSAYEKQRELEALAAKTDFFRKMNHALRTPLTVISTNIQTAWRRPEEAEGLLRDSQEEIMKIAEMIDDALADGEDEAQSAKGGSL